MEWLRDGNAALIATEAELVARLKDIATDTSADDGIGVFLRKATDQEMTIIIAGEAWCLDWFPVGYDGLGSYHTLADDHSPDRESLPESPELLTYYLLGHHGEVPVQFCISEDQALDAIRQFLFTTEMPSAVRWDLD